MPHTIHRIWGGPDKMPKDYRDYGRKWEELNPGWQVKDWTRLPRLINQAVYDDIGLMDPLLTPDPVAVATQRADVASYELLWKYGGIYVNADIEPVRPLDTLLEKVGANAWASFEDSYFLVNAAMGGPARHPFWRAVIDALPERYWNARRGEMNTTTGPHLLTSVWKGWDQGGFVTLPREVFNPVHFSQVPAGGNADGILSEYPPDTIAVHHWGHRKSGRSNLVES